MCTHSWQEWMYHHEGFWYHLCPQTWQKPEVAWTDKPSSPGQHLQVQNNASRPHVPTDMVVGSNCCHSVFCSILQMNPLKPTFPKLAHTLHQTHAHLNPSAKLDNPKVSLGISQILFLSETWNLFHNQFRKIFAECFFIPPLKSGVLKMYLFAYCSTGGIVIRDGSCMLEPLSWLLVI